MSPISNTSQPLILGCIYLPTLIVQTPIEGSLPKPNAYLMVIWYKNNTRKLKLFNTIASLDEVKEPILAKVSLAIPKWHKAK